MYTDSLLCEIVTLEIVIKRIKMSLQEYLKSFERKYQNNFSKAHAFFKAFIVNWDFISGRKPVPGVHERIVDRAVGLKLR